MLVNIHSQPKEIWETVFTFLDSKSLPKVAQTCKFFQTVSNKEKSYRFQKQIVQELQDLHAQVIEFKKLYQETILRHSQTQNQGLTYIGNLRYKLNEEQTPSDLLEEAIKLRVKILKLHHFFEKLEKLNSEMTQILKKQLTLIQKEFSTFAGDFPQSDFLLNKELLENALYMQVLLHFKKDGTPNFLIKKGYDNSHLDFSNEKIHPIFKNINQVKTCKAALDFLKMVKNHPECWNSIILKIKSNQISPSGIFQPYQEITLDEIILLLQKNLPEQIVTSQQKCSIM